MQKKKPVIRTYYPQSVYLPDGIERVVSSERQKSIGHLLPAEEQANYESKTLFYDLFVQSGRLICIGPPFYNIGAPLAIKHKGKNLRFKLAKGGRWRKPAVIEIKIPSQRTKAAPLNLEFVFKEFTVGVSCPCQNNMSLTEMDLGLMGLQKDNPLIWIKDWCRWHIRVHGVQRIVLYDNGSSYWPTLEKELAEINEEVEIILVHWPYKHGPIPDSLNIYRYAKLGMLNHFRLFFGTQISWCINLDPDEFLYFDGPLSLKKYLKLPKNLMRSFINLEHYLFPPGQAPAEKRARFYHHRMRYRPEYWDVWNNPKYICQPNKIQQMTIHYCDSKKLGAILRLLIRKGSISTKWNIIFFLLLNVPYVTLNRRKKAIKKQMINERGKLFFCHLRDLYTDWYGDANRGDEGFVKRTQPLGSVNPAALVEDKRLIDKAIEVGVVTELEVSQESWKQWGGGGGGGIIESGNRQAEDGSSLIGFYRFRPTSLPRRHCSDEDMMTAFKKETAAQWPMTS